MIAMRAQFFALVLQAGIATAGQPAGSGDWANYLGDEERSHYSSLAQINKSNVGQLLPAWEYKTGVFGEMQCNPLIIAGVLYGVTGDGQVFALDASNGVEQWRFMPPGERSHQTLRGLAFWEDGADRRILCAMGSSLVALDAATGRLIETFGDRGWVSLKAGLGEEAQDRWVVSTTPGTVFEDLIIMPTRVSERANAAPGYIQAFNIRSGDLEWVFRTIPLPGDPGSETWSSEALTNPEIGGANSWAGMALDSARGLVFAPTGSAAPDFWGGNRPGQNLFANCLLALDARTGELKWHYQFVHHDIWDRDLPAPPNLLRVRRGSVMIDAVAQVTKSGFIFVFDRETGALLFPVDEVPAPQSSLAGEIAWPTQPVPQLPAPFTRQSLEVDDIGRLAPDRAQLQAVFRAAQTERFAPFNETETILFPGFDGGAEWGGAAVDPGGVLYVNANEMAWVARLRKTPRAVESDELSAGARQYRLFCSACHGEERQGIAASQVPALVDVSSHLSRAEIAMVIRAGKGMMPGFSALPGADLQVLLDYLLNQEKVEGPPKDSTKASQPDSSIETPYELAGYVRFVDQNGYPAINPPWGTLTAIDLNTGEHRWQIPLGAFKTLSDQGHPPTGTENYGGPIVTEGGLLFIAASKDGMFRAFDKTTGQLLWEYALPAPGFATPATYQVGSKQFVVVAAGGGKLGTAKGDSYIAFSLP